MAMIVSTPDIVIQLLHILGLNDQYVGSVVITMNPDDIVKVDVTHLMTEEQSGKILEIMKHYYLAEKDNGTDKTNKET